MKFTLEKNEKIPVIDRDKLCEEMKIDEINNDLNFDNDINERININKGDVHE